jgi:DNA-damage-inducible protein J
MATKTAYIRARIEPEIKKGAEAILKEIGISTSEAISMFLQRVRKERRIPFSTHVPNTETAKALREDLSKAKKYTDMQQMHAEILNS